MPLNKIASVFLLTLLCAAASGQGATPEPDAAALRRDAAAAVQNGDFATAAAGFRKLTEADPDDAHAWQMLGYSLHAGGKLDEALPAHEKAAGFAATASSASYNVACVHALQGRADLAFDWLDKAVARGFADAELLGKDTDLDALREDPRFAKLVAAVRAKAGPVGPQGFAQIGTRRANRIVWFAEHGGQIALSHAAVPWDAKYDRALAEGRFVGKRWRLGADFWTTLDTSVPLRFGDVTLAPGYYYLTLAQPRADTFVVCAHDPVEVRKQRLDPVFAQQLQGGVEIPLAHATGGEIADLLAIQITMVAPRSANGALSIRFGGHTLTAPVTVELGDRKPANVGGSR